MIRTYTDYDFPACVEIVNQVWDFDRKFPPQPLSALFKQMYIGVSLAASNFCVVMEEDGRVIGFLFGKCGDDHLVRNEYSGMWGVVYYLYRLLAVRGATLKKKLYYARIIGVHEKNRRAVEPTRVNEANLLAVDPRIQGKGYGKALMNAYIAYCKTLQVTRITLETDKECNYGFFQHFGFTIKGTFYSPLQQEYSGTSGESYVYELKL